MTPRYIIEDTNPEHKSNNTFDSGWLAFLAAAKEEDPDIESTHGIEGLVADYLPTQVAETMKYATGHESEELFRIGYTLLILERDLYTFDDLAHAISGSRVMPVVNLDLIHRVRDKLALPCYFAEDITRAGFRDIVNLVEDPVEVHSFLERLDQMRTGGRDLASDPILSYSEVKAVLCAEIWCRWLSNEDPEPLLSNSARFVGLFGPETAVEVNAFSKQLTEGMPSIIPGIRVQDC